MQLPCQSLPASIDAASAVQVEPAPFLAHESFVQLAQAHPYLAPTITLLSYS